MPRKNRPPKNRYCRRSKLGEEAFAGLLFDWFANRSAEETAVRLEEHYGVSISRQGVNKYFLNLGYYTFLNTYIPDALLLLLSSDLEQKGFPENIARERRWFFAYSFEFAQSMLKAARIGPERKAVACDRLLAIPAALRLYIEDGVVSSEAMIESTAQGAIFTRLRDNQFLVSALREIRRRTFGYASAHFLSYFGKAYFMEAFSISYEQRGNDQATLNNVWVQIGMRLPLTTSLQVNPMTVMEPARIAATIPGLIRGLTEERREP
ncbi:MAG: hypothetical protein IPH06_13510 [Alphaproteobacteria bacterium]|nr:hypothetical protein [Alphaproteobacteria bacterium]QQS56468.1 MAG: hypothetical protein IPN28_09260 [Alphaproteobacteria bacterium]